jgi:hypothetical protein
MEAICPGLDSLDEADKIRVKVLLAFEEADLATPSLPEPRGFVPRSGKALNTCADRVSMISWTSAQHLGPV